MFFNNSNDSILFNFTTIIINNSSNNNKSLTLMLMTTIQYYAILIFFFICFIFALFLFLFVYNLFCLLLKSFKCCQNDSFYFICDTLNRNHNQAAAETATTSFLGPISSLTNSEEEIRNNKLSLVVVENENNNNNTIYGILNNYSNKTPLLRNDETELSTLPAAQEQQKKLKESSDFYSTFTFKSFKTLEANEISNNNNNNNDDYLDICNTLENVTKSINKELELIENINLSKITTTNNTEIVGNDEEEEDTETNETEKLITDLLPMPDLSSITDLNNDETNLDSSIQDIDNYSDILVVKD